MKSNGAITAEVRTMLTEMVAEAQDLKMAAGGSVTDAVAAWLAPQYLLAARENLETKSGAGRFEVLRTFMHDWATLRRCDHSAARLQLDREELDWQRASCRGHHHLLLAADPVLVGLNTLQHWLWQRLQAPLASEVAA